MTVKIGGKDRPVIGNINGLIELKKEHGVDVINGVENIGFEEIRAVIFVGLKHGADNKPEFTLEEVGAWLTPKSMQSILTSVLAVFMDEVEVKEGEAGERPGESSVK